jgi:glc operon protein GlcG
MKVSPSIKLLLIVTAWITTLVYPSMAQVKPSNALTLEAAEKIIAEATKYAKDNNSPGGSIAVVDAGGNLIALHRLNGTFAASAEVAIEKARTAALFKAPSKKLEDAINGGRQALITVGKTFLQGGIPITYNGEVIGAVGVSGASSAMQDEEVAIAGSKAKFD